MRDMAWRMGVTLTVLIALVVAGTNASCSGVSLPAGGGGQVSAQAQVAAYLAAIAEGDRSQALSFWFLDGTSPALTARRETITDELLAYGPRLEYHVLGVEWWRTHSRPAMTDDPDQAGAARIRVAVSSETQTLEIYQFDLLGPQASASAAAQSPARWIVIDIYPDGATAWAWPWR